MSLVQEADWYKPEPGVPYRPLIAMPSQLKQRVPWLSFCEDIFFSAYDPPTALDSATAFVPVITPGSDHRIQALAAAPSPTIDPGARMTTAGKFSTSASMVGAAAQQTSPLQAHFDPEDSSSDPERGIEKVQSSNINEDPGKQTEPNVPGLPLQHNAAVNSNLDLSVPDHLLLQPTAGTENSIDPNVPDLPLQPTATIKSNQDPTLNAGAVAHNEQKESVDESSTGSESGASKITDPEDTPPADPPQNPNSGSKAPTQAPQHILTTIAGHAITAAPTAVAIAGTTINPGDTGVTLGGTPVALDRSGRLLLGTKTIPLPSGLPEKITTTIAGQAITADSAAVAMESKTLKPGDLAMNVNGTSVALDTAGRFFIGSNIVPFATESANPLVTTIAGQVITAAANAIGIAGTTMKPGDTGFPINGTVLSLDTAGHFVVGATTHTFQSEIASLTVAALGAGGSITTIMPSATQSNASIGIYDIPSTSVQVFTGEAGGLKWSLICLKTVVVIFVMITLVHA